MIASAKALIKELGGSRAVAEMSGVGVSAVSNWIAKGAIPSEYFIMLSEELSRSGKEADRKIFGFRSAIGA